MQVLGSAVEVGSCLSFLATTSLTANEGPAFLVMPVVMSATSIPGNVIITVTANEDLPTFARSAGASWHVGRVQKLFANTM